ncbi:MAG: type I methionyl aminopeptidase [Kiritimatiellaeota bacterium]|nr:type I methionyl aminopeptidase [Kiritimatiellota bacterium]
MRQSAKKRRVVVHTHKEIRGICAAARAAAEILQALCETVRPGMSTLDVDRLAGDLIRQAGGSSAFNGYHGFPGQICISLNAEVVHGIGRADRIIQPGDLVSLDVGVKLDGYIGDTAATVCAGGPAACRTPEAARLIAAACDGLAQGISVAVAGNRVDAIGRAVENVVTRAGFSVVRDFVGHGCGVELHEPPEVPNFASAKRGPRLEPGMVLAIEPMVNAGGCEIRVESDGWTVRTADGALSAHAEHMVLITDGKPEILTWRKTA